jgi:hypothetical protein
MVLLVTIDPMIKGEAAHRCLDQVVVANQVFKGSFGRKGLDRKLVYGQ